ncbi:2'-5' RNA ligase [Enhydrobacter aerosaccus]|uniref:2'-5' RNA ligase n=1 Tax=Enhydrobacter aerosaccus TaxID=225324 RepID=A0A1T4KEE2_9HYPH|nr:2'-5' RNA ligase family protein [Enhydrobacter aerosaccus]SJZ40725.1 2'-5' RNA ligase [Enhydrobacter aerosaccus]
MPGLFASSLETFRPSLGIGGERPSELKTRRLQRRQQQVRQGGRMATDRLFWAILPPPEIAERIADQASRLRVAHGLTGKPLRAEHFHVTLFHVGDGDAMPVDRLADALAERAAAVTMPTFRVAFDRAMSFRNGAFVLRGDDSVIGVEILHQRLTDALDGLPLPARRFTPHLTLLRDSRIVPEQAIEPLEWTVREMVLVHSLLGRTTHRHLVRLSLASSCL